MTAIADQQEPTGQTAQPVLQATGIVKTYGHVVALDAVDLELYPGEVLAVIGDNGAGKSTLIKCLSGAVTPGQGEILLDGQPVQFRSPQDAPHLRHRDRLPDARGRTRARHRQQPLPRARGAQARACWARCSACSTGRDAHQRQEADGSLGIGTLQNMGQAVESLSGGQRQAVAVARAAAFSSKVIILDEPTAALGVQASPTRCSSSS